MLLFSLPIKNQPALEPQGNPLVAQKLEKEA